MTSHLNDSAISVSPSEEQQAAQLAETSTDVDSDAGLSDDGFVGEGPDNSDDDF